jgi:hypothetical protein
MYIKINAEGMQQYDSSWYNLEQLEYKATNNVTSWQQSIDQTP